MLCARLALAVLLMFISLGCGVTTTRDTVTIGAVAPTLTTASVTFMTRGDGKDEDSAVAVQLLDDSGRLASEGAVADIEFDDQTVSQPLTLSVMQPLSSDDLNDARMRLRLTPDGQDTWLFDVRLVVGLSDNTQRTYFWSGVRLDENTPERILPLASGRMP